MKMKKLMVFALATLCSVSMSAQDIKTILGANDYKEALNMIKAGEASLSNENKAKAYNKVVDLALDKFLKEQVTRLTLQPCMMLPRLPSRLLWSVTSMTTCLTRRVR